MFVMDGDHSPPIQRPFNQNELQRPSAIMTGMPRYSRPPQCILFAFVSPFYFFHLSSLLFFFFMGMLSSLGEHNFQTRCIFTVHRNMSNLTERMERDFCAVDLITFLFFDISYPLLNLIGSTSREYTLLYGVIRENVQFMECLWMERNFL